ncbi:hypothetical protein DFH09DRAFT_1159154 [Mycena vulgaris]|nr:hypothetical protein DFH09DRAFT_1159154 [Mycena vulgaris]
MSPTDTTLSPLTDFVHDAFTEMLISTDDAVFEAALHKFVSPNVVESDVATSTQLDRDGLGKVIRQLRTGFTERKFVSETFIVADPADPTNKSGAVGGFHIISALQDGKPVTLTAVVALRVKWIPAHGHHHGGKRQLVTNAWITSTGPEINL